MTCAFAYAVLCCLQLLAPTITTASPTSKTTYKEFCSFEPKIVLRSRPNVIRIFEVVHSSVGRGFNTSGDEPQLVAALTAMFSKILLQLSLESEYQCSRTLSLISGGIYVALRQTFLQHA